MTFGPTYLTKKVDFSSEVLPFALTAFGPCGRLFDQRVIGFWGAVALSTTLLSCRRHLPFALAAFGPHGW